MALVIKEAPKKKRGPGRPRKNEPKTAKYHIYQDFGDGKLTWLGEAHAKNATSAATSFINENDDAAQKQPFLVVPERNISRISATIETVKKLTVITD